MRKNGYGTNVLKASCSKSAYQLKNNNHNIIAIAFEVGSIKNGNGNDAKQNDDQEWKNGFAMEKDGFKFPFQ